MRKTAIIAITLTVILATAAVVIYFHTMSAGKQSLRELAQDGGYCKQADCADGISYAASVLATEFGMSQHSVQWCIGVDELSRRPLFFSEILRDYYVELLYIPCDALAGDMQTYGED